MKPGEVNGQWTLMNYRFSINTKCQQNTEDEVRRVVNNLADGEAKGVDGWSPAELRALSRTHIKGLTDILNKVAKYEGWPAGLRPIIALIAK